MLAILVSLIFAVLLIASSVIDFIVAKKQKDDTDKNLLMGAGAATVIGAVVMVGIIIIISTMDTAGTIKAVGGVFRDNPELAAALL